MKKIDKKLSILNYCTVSKNSTGKENNAILPSFKTFDFSSKEYSNTAEVIKTLVKKIKLIISFIFTTSCTPCSCSLF